MKWLVEIGVKDWVFIPKNQSRILAYEEVEAPNKYAAQLAGYDAFTARAKYQPSVKKMLADLSLEDRDICAPDAVEI